VYFENGKLEKTEIYKGGMSSSKSFH